MHGWWIFMGCLAAAGLALASSHYRRRRAGRARIDWFRAAVDALPLSAPQQPDGATVLDPPTEDSSPVRACAVRPRRRVVLSANDLSITLGPRGRLS